MKQSIAHLPQTTQEELNYLIESITRHIPKCVMIVLYGSFARGGYVLWDEREEFGIYTSYQSDLDILIVMSESNVRITEYQLEERVVENYQKAFARRRHASPQFIVEDINTLNRALEKGRYFYTDAIQEGIMLYDSGEFQLVTPQNLSFKEIKTIAEEEFNKCFPFANGFMKCAYMALEDEMYEFGAFQLHQACERYYYSIGLVFVNYRPKTHRLKDWESKYKRFSRNLVCVFPRQSEFERHCHDLLCRSYIESGYNKDYTVKKEEFEYMLQRVELLKEITYAICTEQIIAYDNIIGCESSGGSKSYYGTEQENTSGMAADERLGYSDDSDESQHKDSDQQESINRWML